MKYPTIEEWRGGNPFGYSSAMVHMAANNDDPDAFMRFLGDPAKAEFFLCGSLIEFAANHGAEKVLRHLWKVGIEHDVYTHEEWLNRCANPPYGPRSKAMRP